jgi:hypothetical protein
MSVQFGGGGGGGAEVTINIVNSGAVIFISGQCVCISGQPVNVSGDVVVTSISGNVVNTSISGTVVVGKVSGQTVYPVSGPGYMYIFDYSGGTWTQAATDTSGSNKLLVAAAVNVAANVSGNVVYLANDGTNNVVIAKTSGQVANIAGQAVTVSGNVISTSISGNVVSTSVSGNVVTANTSVSGNVVSTSVSGNVVSTSISGNVENSQIKAFDPSGAVWNNLWVNASGQNRLLVAVSGQTVTAAGVDINGQTVFLANDGTNNVVVTSVSGNVVKTSGQVAQISGQAVSTSISGNVVVTSVSGNVVSANVTSNISGQVVYLANDATNNVVVTSVSGNVVSTSVSGNVVTARTSGQVSYPVSGQGFLYIWDYSGGTWTQAATSNSGTNKLLVDAGSISVTANVSGNVVYLASVEGSGITSTRFNSKDMLNVYISGQSVLTSVSGNVVTARNSGQTVTARVQAFDPSGVALNDIWVNTSGQNRLMTTISGDVVAISGTVTVAGTVSVDNTPAVTTSVSGNYVSIISGSVAGFSGLAVGTSVSGNVVVAKNSGQTVVPVSGQSFLYIWDYSGATWTQAATSNSGTNKLLVDAGSINVAANVSGNVVYLASIEGSGITSTRANSKDHLNVWISGQSILTSVSGNIISTSVSGNVVAVSGTVTIAGAVTTSVSGNTVLNVPAWYGAVDISGWFLKVSGGGFSGANTVGNYVFDYSGQQFIAWQNVTSGFGVPLVSLASGTSLMMSGTSIVGSISGNSVVTSVSGNVISVTGGGVSISGNVVSVSGSVTTITSVSGNTVKPQTPTFINSIETYRISVASGGVQLSSFACIACTVRNIGNSGDVVFVGSLSSPPYCGTSGQAYPAISGKGFWLRDGDAITLNTTDTSNIKVTANLSGTPVSYIAVG